MAADFEPDETEQIEVAGDGGRGACNGEEQGSGKVDGIEQVDRFGLPRRSLGLVMTSRSAREYMRKCENDSNREE